LIRTPDMSRLETEFSTSVGGSPGTGVFQPLTAATVAPRQLRGTLTAPPWVLQPLEPSALLLARARYVFWSLAGIGSRLRLVSRPHPCCQRLVQSLLVDAVDSCILRDRLDVEEHVRQDLEYLGKGDRTCLVIVHLEPLSSRVFDVGDVVFPLD